ncbi:MAG: peptidylprolyl isomerase [Lachnospiraceae bacterium]|nr:peptidylprolyl isomerase [Lachnospiraceae bacterium]
MRKIKKIATCLLCGLLTFSTFTACGSNSTIFMGRLSDTEVFRIGDNICTLPELKVYLTTAQKQYENVLGVDMWEQDFGGVTLEAYLKENILGQIAQIKSMTLLAEEYGVTLTEEEEKKVQKAANKYFTSLNEKEIKYMEIDEETVASLYREYALANKVYEEITRNVDTEVSDDEARKITVQQILFAFDEESSESTKNNQYKKAQEVLSQVKAQGADFGNIAEKNSEDETVEYTFGKGEKEQPLEDAAFNMENNQISDIIETSYGYIIIKCISNFDRAETDANKDEIVEKRKTEAFDAVYDEFVEQQASQFNDELWAEITFTDDKEISNMTFFEVFNDIWGKE